MGILEGISLDIPGSMDAIPTRDRSSVGLERRPVTAEVAGSSPVGPAILLPNARDSDGKPEKILIA